MAYSASAGSYLKLSTFFKVPDIETTSDISRLHLSSNQGCFFGAQLCLHDSEIVNLNCMANKNGKNFLGFSTSCLLILEAFPLPGIKLISNYNKTRVT